MCVNIDDYYCTFLNVIYNTIPFKRVSRSKCLPLSILKLQNSPNRLWKKYRANLSAVDLQRHKLVTKELKFALKEHFTEEGKCLNSRKADSFYLVCLYSSKKPKPASVLVHEGKPLENDLAKANAYNSFFVSNFVLDDQTCPYFASKVARGVGQISPKFDALTISESLSSLKAKHSLGPDGLSAYFVKKLGTALFIPLEIIFNVSYTTGKIPEFWRKAVVVPIHKKGDISLIENYRPVSLCCVCCKLMESIINRSLITYLESQSLLTGNQFGFRKNKSCELQLINCKNRWTALLDRGIPTDAV